jgi:Ca-activated chloride channel homolog
MFFLNLSLGEFLGLLGGIGGLITALYLLDRAKRKKLVSTLRFWTSASAAEEKQTRKRMRDPWSLILQLVSLLLLLLAIAQLQWGTRERSGHDHVLLLDTSSWSAEVNGGGTVLESEKRRAQQYVRRLPGRDRVMIAEADALVTPLTSFTADRGRISGAIQAVRSGLSSLNVHQAFQYAQQAQTWSGGQPGEIVYIGPAQTDANEQPVEGISNLRLILVPVTKDNLGIAHIAARRADIGAGEWQASVTVRNYAASRRTVRLNTRFGESRFAPRVMTLEPGHDSVAEYVFDTEGAGKLTAELDSADSLPEDNHAAIALPHNGLLRIAVFSHRPEEWRPLLQADPRLSPRFFDIGQYRPKPDADIVLLDGVTPPLPPALPTVWVEPPTASSPLPVKARIQDTRISAWNAASEIASGLRTHEARLASAEVFQIFDGDIPVASTPEGPIVVARAVSRRQVQTAVIGFDPLSRDMKFQVLTPLLFSNLLHWISPEPFLNTEVSADRVGVVSLSLPPDQNPDQIRVRSSEAGAVPFAIHRQVLQLFVTGPEIVTVASPGRERILSITLPDVAQHTWQPPARTASGLPAPSAWAEASVTLWQALAVLGGVGLVAEWLLFGLRRKAKLQARLESRSRSAASRRQSREQELVSR